MCLWGQPHYANQWLLDTSAALGCTTQWSCLSCKSLLGWPQAMQNLCTPNPYVSPPLTAFIAVLHEFLSVGGTHGVDLPLLWISVVGPTHGFVLRALLLPVHCNIPFHHSFFLCMCGSDRRTMLHLNKSKTTLLVVKEKCETEKKQCLAAPTFSVAPGPSCPDLCWCRGREEFDVGYQTGLIILYFYHKIGIILTGNYTWQLNEKHWKKKLLI